MKFARPIAGLLWRHVAAAVFFIFATQLLAAEKAFTKEDREHWAFQPVKRVAVPPSAHANPIDAFVDVKLKENGLVRNEAAGRRTWLRRASLDLLGLPPTPEELHSFLDDTSADAYGAAIDRMLASARYGERWARH